MQQEELQKWVEAVSENDFGKPFRHQASFNLRLRTTGGRYLLRTHNLEFNPKQLEVFGSIEFEKIIKHELCHYHLHLEGKGYRHQDPDFKNLLSLVGGSRYCQLIPGARRQSAMRYTYMCKKCQAQYIRKRKIDLKRYRCGRCGGRLELLLKLQL